MLTRRKYRSNSDVGPALITAVHGMIKCADIMRHPEKILQSQSRIGQKLLYTYVLERIVRTTLQQFSLLSHYLIN